MALNGHGEMSDLGPLSVQKQTWKVRPGSPPLLPGKLHWGFNSPSGIPTYGAWPNGKNLHVNPRRLRPSFARCWQRPSAIHSPSQSGRRSPKEIAAERQPTSYPSARTLALEAVRHDGQNQSVNWDFRDESDRPGMICPFGDGAF
jgi:hypothetical protein